MIEYIPIKPRALQSEVPIAFNLFVKVNEKYLLFIRSGDDIEADRLEKLRNFRGERLFISRGDLPSFRNFVGEVLNKALNDEEPSVDFSSGALNSPDKQSETVSGDIEEDQAKQVVSGDIEEDQSKQVVSGSAEEDQSKQVVSGGEVEKPLPKLTPQMKKLTAQARLQQKAEIVDSVATTAVDIVSKVIEDPDSLEAFQIAQQAAKGLRAAVQKNPGILKKLYTRRGFNNKFLENHAKNVAALACHLGWKCRLPNAELDDLGAAALLHDIGISKMDREEQTSLFPKRKELFMPDDKRMYFFHVDDTVKMIENKDFVNSNILDLVENHEENLSGRGPKRQKVLTDSQQILSLCNRYDKILVENDIDHKDAIQHLSLNEIGNYDLKLIEKLKKVIITEGFLTEEEVREASKAKG